MSEDMCQSSRSLPDSFYLAQRAERRRHGTNVKFDNNNHNHKLVPIDLYQIEQENSSLFNSNSESGTDSFTSISLNEDDDKSPQKNEKLAIPVSKNQR